MAFTTFFFNIKWQVSHLTPVIDSDSENKAILCYIWGYIGGSPFQWWLILTLTRIGRQRRRQPLKVSFLLYIVRNLIQKCRNDAGSWQRKCKVCDNITAWKGSKYKVFSGPHFPVFGLNTDIYRVNLCIESEYRKIRTRKNSVYGHFSCSVYNQKKSIAQHEKRHDQAFK